ncbi:preprotein translocase subunit SecG [Alphaproteobacteria bacterium]
MFTTLVVFQVFVVLLLILSVLIQQGSSDGMANLASSSNVMGVRHSSSNILTKVTTVLGVLLMLNSIILARITYHQNNASRSIIEEIDNKEGSLALDETYNKTNGIVDDEADKGAQEGN